MWESARRLVPAFSTRRGDGAMSGGWFWALYWEKPSLTELSEETGERGGRGLFRGVAILVGVGSSAGFRSTKGDDNRDGGAV